MNRFYHWHDGTLSTDIPAHAGVDEIYVHESSAKAEIDKRDEQIADLKALLFRAADAVDVTLSLERQALVAEIEKALA